MPKQPNGTPGKKPPAPLVKVGRATFTDWWKSSKAESLDNQMMLRCGGTGLSVAKAISRSLAKRTVAMALDGALADLGDAIERDAKIESLIATTRARWS